MAPLSRERIVLAAIDFIDADGLENLTMRALGRRIGVEAMSMYRYVPSRDDLLDSVVEHLMNEMWSDPEVLHQPDHGWQDFLRRLAHGVRRVALAHPHAYILIASRPPRAPWLRPPLRSLSWVEVFLGGLTSQGFSDERAATSYRAFSSFLLGHLLLDVASVGVDPAPIDNDNITDPAENDLSDYPTVRRLTPILRQDHAAEEFDQALDAIIERLATLRR